MNLLRFFFLQRKLIKRWLSLKHESVISTVNKRNKNPYLMSKRSSSLTYHPHHLKKIKFGTEIFLWPMASKSQIRFWLCIYLEKTVIVNNLTRHFYRHFKYHFKLVRCRLRGFFFFLYFQRNGTLDDQFFIAT